MSWSRSKMQYKKRWTEWCNDPEMAPCQWHSVAATPSDLFTIVIFAMSSWCFSPFLLHCMVYLELKKKKNRSHFRVFQRFLRHPCCCSQHGVRATIPPLLFTCGISWSLWGSWLSLPERSPRSLGWLGGETMAAKQGLKSGWIRGGLSPVSVQSSW